MCGPFSGGTCVLSRVLRQLTRSADWLPRWDQRICSVYIKLFLEHTFLLVFFMFGLNERVQSRVTLPFCFSVVEMKGTHLYL